MAQTSMAQTSTAHTGSGNAHADGGSVPPGYRDRKEQVLKRLRRAEGQVRGIARMVEDDRYCIDVLTQVSAATRALESVALELLDEHLRHCLVTGAQEGPERADELVAEAGRAISRLVRS